MKCLIAIMSCESFRLNGNNQALRDTWLPSVAEESGLEYKIFMGQGSRVERDDEVYVDVPDDYQHISYKGREVHRYAFKRNFDYIFKCFPDTYVCPSRLMDSGFQDFDYVGNFACRPKNGPEYCTGGAGYFLSKKSYSRLLNESIPEVKIIEQRPIRVWNRNPAPVQGTQTRIINDLMWAEDKWSGWALAAFPDLKRYHDIRYEEDVYGSGPEVGNKTISIHLSRSTREGMSALYDKQWMYDKHHNWLNSSLEGIKKVAVITPTLPSRSVLLRECREYVSKQDWSGEILHVVGEDKRKEGPSAVRNRLVHDLDPSFEWIAFVDDDDKLLPCHISTLVNNSAGADVVYSDCLEEGFIKTWKTRKFNYDAVKADNYIPITVLMRRSLFDKVGGFKMEPPGEDQELFLRCALSGARFRYVPKETWIYRQHPQHRELPPRRFQSISRIVTG